MRNNETNHSFIQGPPEGNSGLVPAVHPAVKLAHKLRVVCTIFAVIALASNLSAIYVDLLEANLTTNLLAYIGLI